MQEYPQTRYWVYVPGGLASLAGLTLFYFAGENMTVMRLGSIFFWGGLLLVAACNFLYGSPAAWRSFYRAAIAVAGFLLILGGIMTGLLLIAGTFDAPEIPYRAAGAVAALLAGMGAAYYGLKYQQSQEGLAVGRALGFEEADGRVGGDGVYDAKGLVHGVLTLIDVEQDGPGGRPSSVGSFNFTVLCRPANSAGVRLVVLPPRGQPGADAPEGLAPVGDVLYWKAWAIFANKPGPAVTALSAARLGGGVFDEEHGFKGMTLEGDRFEFRFRKDGILHIDYARDVVRAAAALAANFQ